MLLLAFYEKPDSRRHLWRQALLDGRPPTASREQPVPSLEFIALQRHDPEFLERDVDAAAVQDALRDFSDLVESVGDAPDWQHPALAAWPALQRDIAAWNALPEDRRNATALALFAVATILDDHRFLRVGCPWYRFAPRGFLSALQRPDPEDAPPADGHDVIRQWKEDLQHHSHHCAHPRRGSAPVRALARSPDPTCCKARRILSRDLRVLLSPELLNRASYPSSSCSASTTSWRDTWRTVIRPFRHGRTESASNGAQSTFPTLPTHLLTSSPFSADVERLEDELESALDALACGTSPPREPQRATSRKITRQAEADDDPLKRLDAQDREPQLAQELSSAAAAVQKRARPGLPGRGAQGPEVRSTS